MFNRRQIITQDGQRGYVETNIGDKWYMVLDEDGAKYPMYREEFEFTEEDEMRRQNEWQPFINRLGIMCMVLLIILIVYGLFFDVEADASTNVVNDGLTSVVEEVNNQLKSAIDVVLEFYHSNKDTITEEEFDILFRIVEAEATGESYLGKQLVATVILNRVEYDGFPDTIESVVFQKIHGTNYYQFSPLYDGRYWNVSITEATRLAVNEVLNSDMRITDALYFQAKSLAKSGSWQHDNLEFLFEFGGHAFYR